MITTQKLKNVEQKVAYILENYLETRNSDIELFAKYCERFYPPFERPIYNWRDLAGAMYQVTNFDHISRCRRKAIERSNYKKWLPTDKNVAMNRGYSEEVWREYAKENNIKVKSTATDSNIPPQYNDDGSLR